jgi:glc operon protein GlcG
MKTYHHLKIFTGLTAALLITTNTSAETNNNEGKKADTGIKANSGIEVGTLQLDHILKMNAKCLEHARKSNYYVSIAIYDQGGILLSFIQSDNTAPGVGEVARWKGTSSAFYRVATAETAKWNVPNAPKMATIQGGLPLFSSDGKPLGGIGVSGAPAEFDEECAAQATQAAGLRN